MSEPLRITKILCIGTSHGIIVPKGLLDATGLQRGDQVYVAVGHDMSINIKKVDMKIII